MELNFRSAGILLHSTSLPGPHGCGDLGPAAYRFIDWLARSGMRWWQMLPVGPVSADGAPYSSYSAFAGGAHFISLEMLAEEGLLARRDLQPPVKLPSGRVDFLLTLRFRERVLRGRVFPALESTGSAGRTMRREYQRYCRSQPWLADYALFCALRKEQAGRAWNKWPKPLRRREPGALRAARERLREDIEFECFVQFLFDRQWSALRRYAESKNVALLGDIPIFVGLDSSDVWANPELFQLDRDGRPKFVSGCPPDIFSKTGQLWGHPLYHWSAHQRTGFQWWIERFGRTLSQFHAARIDHFLGFNRCWAVPGRHKTALRGEWQPSPGRELFTALRKAIREPQIIAEDLGFVTPEAAKLRDDFGFPGMRILQNAFWAKARYDQPHNYPRNGVVYTGTHDNDTVAGWFKNITRDRRRGVDKLTSRQRALRYLDCGPDEVSDQMIRAALASPANTAIIPLQDVLGLDNRARMNIPATVSSRNWSWRMPENALREADARRLRAWCEAYERA